MNLLSQRKPIKVVHRVIKMELGRSHTGKSIQSYHFPIVSWDEGLISSSSLIGVVMVMVMAIWVLHDLLKTVRCTKLVMLEGGEASHHLIRVPHDTFAQHVLIITIYIFTS